MPQSGHLDSGKEGQAMSSITRACDMCRRKKIRCDVVSEVCAQCIKYKTACHFTPISTKRAPRRSGRDKRVQELEKRLESMEAELKRTVSDRHPRSSAAELGGDSRLSGTSSLSHSSDAGVSSLSNSGSNWDPASATAGEKFRTSDLCNPLPFVCGSTITSNQRAILPKTPSFLNNGLKGHGLNALPSKDRILNLVEKSFQGFHPVFPLFDQTKFMSVLNSLDTSFNDIGWWACLNVVLALAPQFRHATAHDMEEDRETWGYFQNAFAVALLGMALLIQGTPNQASMSLLTSAAIKQAHRMGLHRRCHDPNISAAEIEERKRVFWIAYCLDKDLSLQMRQPPTQDDDDMDVELPFDNDGSLIFTGESTDKSLLTFRAQLATIQGQIYKRLYSVKATKQSVAERVEAARELENILQVWRGRIPNDLMRDFDEPFIQLSIQGTGRHPTILQLLYFDSLAIIHNSLPALPRYRELQGLGDPVEFQLLAAPLMYVIEARKAIRLLQVTPRRKYACVWAVLHIFVTATKTLLENIVCDPSNPMALSDLMLIEPLLTLLDVLAKSYRGSRSERLSGMHQSCKELFEKAKIAIESTDLVVMDWDHCLTSGQSQGSESMEDFLRRMDNISSGYDMELDNISPGISRDFAFAVQHQFQESAST